MLSYSAYINEDQLSHNLKSALFIHEYELNDLGRMTLKLFEDDEELRILHTEVAWLIQSVWEFQDLQGGKVFTSEMWKKQGYCYFESLNILRESILAGINSFYHLSITGLRSSLELILLHIYWETINQRNSDMNQFTKWIHGEEKKLPFSKLILFVEENFHIPIEWELIKSVKENYKKLCSYAHTPILKESFTQIKNTNQSFVAIKATVYWMKLLKECLNNLLHLLVVSNPLSLFPLDLVSRFGFNQPIGLFFDKYNTLPIRRVLGDEKWEVSKTWFRKHDLNVQGLLDWFTSHKELKISEIKNTWSKDEKHTKEFKKLKHIIKLDDPKLREILFLQKVKIRVIQMGFIYS